MSSKQKNNAEKTTLKIFFGFFSGAIILAAIVIAGFYFIEKGRATDAIIEREEIRVDLMIQTIKKTMTGLVSDIEILAEDKDVIAFISGDEQESELAEEVESFLISKKIYSQFRILDRDGMEIFRAGYEKGSFEITPESNLQDKSDRYYYAEARKLSKDEVFVSKFDLNQEFGEIQVPYQPVIRLVTPIVDNSGAQKGFIILNYNGLDLINSLKAYYVNGEGELLFTNNEGYYFISPRKEEEWGFQFSDLQDKTLALSDPNLWGAIEDGQEGDIEKNEGLYIFEKIILGTIKTDLSRVKGIDQHWFVISRISNENIQLQLEDDIHDLVILAIIFLMLSGTGIFIVAYSVSKAVTAEKQAKNLNEILKIINKMLRHDVLGKFTSAKLSLELYRTDKDRESLQLAEQSVISGIQLVQRLRNLEKVMPEDMSLKNIEIAKTVNELVKQYPIDIEINGDATIQADEALSAVFDNLIKNAIRHGHATRVVITTHELPDVYEIEVADNGSGIPEKVQENIFEEGFTAGSTGNTGIGLYIVKKTIDRYGGTIEIKKNPKKGAIFVITIPK